MATRNRYGAYLPTTNVFDIKDFNEVRTIFNNMALVINTKDTGIYSKSEFVNGQVWFPDPALTSYTPKTPTKRQVYRKVIDFGALPNAGTTTVAHGITFPAANTFSFTRIYAAASDQTAGSYLPIPYVSVAAANNGIELFIDNTNVSITTGVDRTMYTICYVVLEYIKE